MLALLVCDIQDGKCLRKYSMKSQVRVKSAFQAFEKNLIQISKQIHQLLSQSKACQVLNIPVLVTSK